MMTTAGDVTAQGVHDLVGNVHEMINGWYDHILPADSAISTRTCHAGGDGDCTGPRRQFRRVCVLFDDYLSGVQTPGQQPGKKPTIGFPLRAGLTLPRNQPSAV